MATKVTADQLDAAAMSQFFQFLQCQLRLEAEEKLKQEVWLEDKDSDSHMFTNNISKWIQMA